MELDHDVCYASLQSKDARFDGRFFTAVLTTGVYCRPVCPARLPRRENVRFYPSAAAAAEAGFRPCLRCRPEAAPGAPDWTGSAQVVTRALQLIAEGVLDDGGVAEVARRLHLSERQLRRLFVQHLGATPLAVAQTRRIHFARQLVSETALPLAQVAFSAGFASLRRFNAAFRQAYGRPPSAFRQGGRGLPAAPPDLELTLPYRLPFDWQSLLDFFRLRAIPGVEAVDGQSYRRTVRLGTAAGVIAVSHDRGRHSLRLRVPYALAGELAPAVQRVRRLFDLQADPAVIQAHLGVDPLLGPLVSALPGLRVPGAWDGFEIAVRAILGQQVSVAGARTLARRLVEACGEALPEPGSPELGRLFPSPERLAEARLAGLGMPGRRAEAIRALAQAVAEGRLAFSTPAGLDQAVEQLVALPGIGPWTAHYIALRALGEPDAFPAGDLALQKAASALAGEPLSAARLERRAEAWQPWRSYATLYLWSSLALPPAARPGAGRHDV